MRHWNLQTGDQLLTIGIENNVPVILSAKLLSDDADRICTPSPIALPESYLCGEEYKPFAWKYEDAKEEKDGLSLYFVDPAASVRYTLRVLAYCDVPGPFDFSGLLENLSEETIRVKTGDLFSVKVKTCCTPIAWHITKESGIAEGIQWHLDSTKFEGPGIYKDALNVGDTSVAAVNTFQSFNSNGHIPMIYLNEGDQRGSYAALEWSSGAVRAHRCCEECVRLSVSLNDNFNTRLPAGKSMIIPHMYFGVYIGDVDDGSNIFKRWFFQHKVPAILRDNPKEPYTQLDFQADIEPMKKLGVESLKWDYGWWSNDRIFPDRESGWPRTLEGSWKVRDEGILAKLRRHGCETLAEFGALMKKEGLNFAIYVLLHDAMQDVEGLTSAGENGHPEWFSNRRIADGMGCSADLGNEECVEFLKKTMLELFKGNNVPTWRSDFEPICSSSDKENRHDANGTDVEYWCTVGFCELVDYLYANYPDFRYESCSSGGSMKDFLTMTRCVVINNDDSANYNSLRTTFYDASYCFHPTQLQAPCNGDTFCPGSRYYQEPADQDYGMRSIILGVPMSGSWLGCKDGVYNGNLHEYFARYYPMYSEKIRPLVREGNLYHILPRPDGVHWDGVQYANPAAASDIKGAAFVFKPSDAEGDRKVIRMRGLCPETTYHLEFEDRPEQNVSISGEKLMNQGLEVTIEGKSGSEIIWIKA